MTLLQKYISFAKEPCEMSFEKSSTKIELCEKIKPPKGNRVRV